MDENRALRDYKEQEVTEDPLLVLTCGHVLPMSSLDGYMSLDAAYTKSNDGSWHRPAQIMVRITVPLQLLVLQLVWCKDRMQR